jgi:hypothetical protein
MQDLVGSLDARRAADSTQQTSVPLPENSSTRTPAISSDVNCSDRPLQAAQQHPASRVHRGYTDAAEHSGEHRFHGDSESATRKGLQHENVTSFASDVAGGILGVQDTEDGRHNRQQFENAFAALHLDSPGQRQSDCTEDTVISSPSASSSSISPLPACSTPPAQMSTFVSPGLLADPSTLNTSEPDLQPHTASIQPPGSSFLASHSHLAATLIQPPSLPGPSPAPTQRDNSCTRGDNMLENLPPQARVSGEGQRSVGDDTEVAHEADQRSPLEQSKTQTSGQHPFYHGGGSFTSPWNSPHHSHHHHHQVLVGQDKASHDDEQRRMPCDGECDVAAPCWYRLTTASSPPPASTDRPFSMRPCTQPPDVSGQLHGMQQHHRAASMVASPSASQILHEDPNKQLLHPQISSNHTSPTICAYKGAHFPTL